MKLPKINTLFKLNDENKTRLIGLLTILISLWLILYLIPQAFVSLFNTLLGNIILIIVFLLTYMNNRLYGLLMGFVFLLLFRFYQMSSETAFIRDGFTSFNGTEPTKGNFRENSVLNFLKIQNTINRQKVFDMNVIGTQASQEELDYFNENGKWPWSQKVIELYKDAVEKNPYVREDPSNAVNYARTIYNEAAITRILTYQTKEGSFLLNGVLVKDPSSSAESKEELPNGFGDFPYESGLIDNKTYDIIKCNLKKDNSIPELERITYTGKGKIYGEQTEKITPVDYNELENIIPGFTFINSPCNPCGSMASVPDYSCAYELKVKNKPSTISEVWQYLWNIEQ